MAMERSLGTFSRSLHKICKSTHAQSCANRLFTTSTTSTASSIARSRSYQPIAISAHRCIHTSGRFQNASPPPRNHGRGPQDNNETRADLASFDVLRNTAAPATAIDACTPEGFALDNGMRISGSGILLVGGEVFRWRPWLQEHRKEGTVGGGATGEDEMTGRLLNKKGQWEVPNSAWGVLELIYPKPDLLIIGTGPHTIPIAPSVREYLNSLGLRLEIQDTGNASAQFNLLATERGVEQVAAALIPLGWREGR
ncbi:hypothetical protein DM02DRAFT_595347 [Periconia macrospinosa]|uniref:NADH dehydrogenase [ubiquinone] 1 alpha subcomplex assembly factor 3 n=1 Tax=Periconia macrospinosa TaxID=97972 RepID=A0A2V1DNI0_9PLEO|nr:hypothetical protein DM02DRAFT_595347 [Periconia macrospinosa]